MRRAIARVHRAYEAELDARRPRRSGARAPPRRRSRARERARPVAAAPAPRRPRQRRAGARPPRRPRRARAGGAGDRARGRRARRPRISSPRSASSRRQASARAGEGSVAAALAGAPVLGRGGAAGGAGGLRGRCSPRPARAASASRSRGCVQREAGRGVPFDRMAILLRAPAQYRAHLEEALRRASVPAHFARGTVQPDPGGRAPSWRSSRAPRRSSRRARFAEYLSLGQVPDANDEGEPPRAAAARPSAGCPPTRSWCRASPPTPDVAARRLELRRLPRRAAAIRSRRPPATSGTLRAPRRWERLLVESAVIGGLDRWEARLAALERKLALDLAALEVAADAAAERVRRSLADLARAAPLRAAAAARARGAARAGAPGATGSSASGSSARARCAGPIACSRCSPSSARWRRWARSISPRCASRSAGGSPIWSSCPRSAPPAASSSPRSRRRAGLAFDVVFVPGVAERLFPQKVNEEPILRDRERAPLGLDTNDERVAAERLALRLAVGAARRAALPLLPARRSRPVAPARALVLRARGDPRRRGQAPRLRRAGPPRRGRVGGARIGWPAPRRPELAIDEAEYDLALLEKLFQLPEERDGGHRPLPALRQRPPGARAPLPRPPLDGAQVDARRRPRRPHRPRPRRARPPRASARAATRHRAPDLRRLPLQVPPPRRPPPLPARDPRGHRGARPPPARLPRPRGPLRALRRALREGDLLPVTPATLEQARARLDAVLGAVAARFHDELSPAIERVWDDGIASVRADLREWLRRAAAGAAGWTPVRASSSRSASPSASSATPRASLDPVAARLRDQAARLDRSGRDAAPPAPCAPPTTRPAACAPRQGATVIGGGEALQPVLYALALEKLFPDARVEEGRLYYCTSAGGFEEVAIPLDDRGARGGRAGGGDHRRARWPRASCRRRPRRGRARTASTGRCAGRTRRRGQGRRAPSGWWG